jgi:hypothetical protein
VDEGLPIAYQVLEQGIPVYASGGEEVGALEHVFSAPEEDIFHGIAFNAGGARRFLAADQIASLHERGVDLRIDAAEVAGLPEPDADTVAWRAREPGVAPSRWKMLLDKFSGADPMRRNWSKED